jgi:hypothetical protein
MDQESGTTIIRQYQVTTASSGDTATTICDAFRSLINADPIIHVAATGAATLILTAETGWPQFTVNLQFLGGGLTQVAGTAGVFAVGTLASLALQGITVTNATYYQVHLEFTPIIGDNLKNPIQNMSVWDAYINAGDGDTAALIVTWTEELGNLVLAAAAASIENFALL